MGNPIDVKSTDKAARLAEVTQHWARTIVQEIDLEVLAAKRKG
jgi:hypothetical protein